MKRAFGKLYPSPHAVPAGGVFEDMPLPENRSLRSDWIGSLIGLVTFVGGIGLLVVTFQLAFTMFSVPPSETVAGPNPKEVNLNLAFQSLGGLVIRSILLLVMCVVGSVVANRGIRLYVSCRHPAPSPEKPEVRHAPEQRERLAG